MDLFAAENDKISHSFWQKKQSAASSYEHVWQPDSDASPRKPSGSPPYHASHTDRHSGCATGWGAADALQGPWPEEQMVYLSHHLASTFSATSSHMWGVMEGEEGCILWASNRRNANNVSGQECPAGYGAHVPGWHFGGISPSWESWGPPHPLRCLKT